MISDSAQFNSTIPGVQKVKAALRQTRRLLAKAGPVNVRPSYFLNLWLLQDGITADVRVAAERKLKAQEADLRRAEIAKKERTMATRYHKVKFFGESTQS
jgi:hypothetical protein